MFEKGKIKKFLLTLFCFLAVQSRSRCTLSAAEGVSERSRGNFPGKVQGKPVKLEAKNGKTSNKNFCENHFSISARIVQQCHQKSGKIRVQYEKSSVTVKTKPLKAAQF